MSCEFRVTSKVVDINLYAKGKTGIFSLVTRNSRLAAFHSSLWIYAWLASHYQTHHDDKQ